MRPEPATPVSVRDQQGGEYRAEVLEAHPGHLVLAAMDEIDTVDAPESGTRLLVTWSDDAGLLCLPVLLVDSKPPDPTTWLVDIVGQPWREQRRQHLRAAIGGAVGLRFAAATAHRTVVSAQLIDVSEVGLRCAVEEGHSARYPQSTPVVAQLTLGEATMEVQGQVLLSKPAAGLDGRVEIVVLFDRPVQHAEQIRHFIRESRPSRVVRPVWPVRTLRAAPPDGQAR
jgi:hypothetical protein